MKKVLNIVKTVITWLLVILSVAIMIFTVVSVTSFDRNDRSIFGVKAFIVKTDSMSATDFSAGDLIILKEVDPATLNEGDIIAYQSTASESFGETITHKIRRKITDSEGQPCFITYGTTTDTDDEQPVYYTYVQGKYLFNLPKVGTFFAFLKTPKGYVIFILLPFSLLILMQAFNTLKIFKEYKRQQQEEIENERRAIESEREETKRLLEELTRMKAEMAANAAQTADKQVSQPDEQDSEE